MDLTPELRARIQSTLQANRVVLFMKGSPAQPRCGFSAKAAGILDGLLDDYGHVDVLADAEIREGIKAYGQWPTIPQLYVDGELLGGSDIIEQMLNSGELHAALGVAAPDRTPPKITVTELAAAAIRRAMADADPDAALHLAVDPRFNAQFQLRPAAGNEIVVEAGGLRLHLDLASAPRARGLVVDWVEDARGAGLSIHNPNAPPAVKPLDVQDLHDRLIAGTIDVVDVRPAAQRAAAPFPLPHEVLDEASHDRIAALNKATPLAFLCHHGNSSRQAAEHFRGLGFLDLYNVEGGIDAWSEKVDPKVPRY
jgi:monothiol glutaredoxin